MKRNKILRIIAAVTGLAIIGGIGLFANAMMGNPLSKAIVKYRSEQYVESVYSDLELEVEEPFYSFKTGDYLVRVKSPVSVDTHFHMYYTMTGRMRYDSFENDVTDGWNTCQRLEYAYRKMTDRITESEDFPYGDDIAYGWLRFYHGEGDPEWGFRKEDFRLDGEYDINELGRQAGELTVYANDDEVTVERAAEILLDIRRIFDEADIGFYAIDFVLQKPKPEEGPWPDRPRINVDDFLYTDIHENGLTDRIQAAHDALEAYYAEEDAKRAEAEEAATE